MSREKKASGNTKRPPVRTPLKTIRSDAAGIDIGSSEHWVCAPATAENEANVERFGTTTPELEALADWLVEQGVVTVAMESTHVYWIPIYELLEARGFEVVLVNARQLSNVPGRKTDWLDCQWTQILHSCGLLRPSFRPTDAICHLRAIRRQLANLVDERTRTVQWMQKSLDQMNVQVHRAVTDITGKTGMAIVRAIVAGERDPNVLATNRDKRCRKSKAEIAEYLTGNWRDDHLFNLARTLELYDVLDQQIITYEAQLLRQLEELQPPDRKDQPIPAHPNSMKQKAMSKRGELKLRTALWRFCGSDLTRIDGISAPAALVVLTEVGPDVSAFPDESHFVSWLRLSPRHAVSGGKPLPKKRRNAMGATRVAGVLRMAALALARSKTALGAYFRRIARRKAGNVAVFATARKLAQLIYRMLRYGQDYVDIGEEHYEARFQQERLAGIKNAAKSMGYVLVPAESKG